MFKIGDKVIVHATYGNIIANIIGFDKSILLLEIKDDPKVYRASMWNCEKIKENNDIMKDLCTK